MTDLTTIPDPEEIAELLLDQTSGCGCDECRENAIRIIAKAIHDAVMAEREKKAATTRKKIIEALADFPHMIDSDKVEIRFDPRRPGHNALNQFLTVLEEQFSAAPKAEG